MYLYINYFKSITNSSGIFRDFGLFSDEDAKYNQAFAWYAWEIPIFLIIGVIGGLMGALFVSINLKVSEWRNDWMQKYPPGIEE